VLIAINSDSEVHKCSLMRRYRQTKYSTIGVFFSHIIHLIVDEATSFATQQQQQQQQQQRRQERSAVRRNRRSVQIIMPGTQWCGDGNVSTDGQSHGNIIATDRCCQQHDSCSYTIGSFSRKYGLFNYRLHTISHCECDDVYVIYCCLINHSFVSLI